MPGEHGTKKLLRQYGDKLVCVRYRYDIEKSESLKTVELIIERNHWEASKSRIHPNKIVEIKINYGEIQLGRLVKNAGGKWNPMKKVWKLPYREVKALGLEKRIVYKPP